VVEYDRGQRPIGARIGWTLRSLVLKGADSVMAGLVPAIHAGVRTASKWRRLLHTGGLEF
jgi:hypothetical protein